MEAVCCLEESIKAGVPSEEEACKRVGVLKATQSSSFCAVPMYDSYSQILRCRWTELLAQEFILQPTQRPILLHAFYLILFTTSLELYIWNELCVPLA